VLLRRPKHPSNVAFVQWHFSHIALIQRHVRSAEADIRPLDGNSRFDLGCVKTPKTQKRKEKFSFD
jgi:hypothetical protein